MRVLGSLRAFGDNYEVRDDPDDLGVDVVAGRTDHGLLRVTLDTSSPIVQSTYLHEIIHIIDVEMHIQLSEATIVRLETGIRSVWRDNGWELPRVGENGR